MADREPTIEERIKALEDREISFDDLPMREVQDYMENNLTLFARGTSSAAGTEDSYQVGP